MSGRAQAMAETIAGATFDTPFGEAVVAVPPESLAEAAIAARDAGFDMFIDLCAVDHLTRSPRFEVVVSLLSLDPPERLRLVAAVGDDMPTAPTITGSFPGADFYEREAFDLFGIRFEGHPDMTRILLPDDWVGHPLRKDSPVGSVPVQFKGVFE